MSSASGALEVVYYEELHPRVIDELRNILGDEGQLDILDDITDYNLYVLIFRGHRIHGLAAVRIGSGRLTCDVCVMPGRGSIQRTETLIDAVEQLTGRNPISVEWWSRGASSSAARTVANKRRLPEHRRILRLERHLPTLAGALPDVHVTVRHFRAGDADDVVAVNNAAFVEHPDRFDFSVEQLFASIDNVAKARDLLLTDIDGELAGFIWTRPAKRNSIGELYVLAVDPRFQGRGLGSCLVEAGIRHLYDNRGVRTAMLHVDASDTRSVDMYKRHGFVDTKNDLISYLV